MCFPTFLVFARQGGAAMPLGDAQLVMLNW
jgi:hypothetical protein